MSLEANRRARVTGFSTIKYWIENDIDAEDIQEMPKPHYRPHCYIKTSLLWAFYYLQHEIDVNEALKDILMKGGDVMGNATIVGGLLAASQGMEAINPRQVRALVRDNQQP